MLHASDKPGDISHIIPMKRIVIAVGWTRYYVYLILSYHMFEIQTLYRLKNPETVYEDLKKLLQDLVLNVHRRLSQLAVTLQ